jgi:amidase/aspartyl-tRNA(Asn)/glutamyl-tRNA(Gln) amidotransferase subunit A
VETRPAPGPSWRWSVVEMASALDAGVISSAEVVADALDRIESADPAVKAFVTVRDQRAMDAAAEATQRRHRGQPRSPIDGIPVAVKDLFPVGPDVATTMGSLRLQSFQQRSPAPLVRRLEAAGCVIIGTTNMCELAHKATTDNALVGPTSTPFAPGLLNAGGSSGGSAAAVAAMMVPAALGSDGAGSIRIPAALCGVVGLKPTFGVVPNGPRPDAFRAAALFASGGPITRSVGDAAVMLDVLSGPDPSDPFSLARLAETAAAGLRQPVTGLRLGVSPTFGGFPVDPDVLAAVAQAAATLEGAGCRVDLSDFVLPAPHGELCQIVRRAIGDAIADTLVGLWRVGAFTEDPRGWLEATTVGLVDEARSVGHRDRVRHSYVRTQLLDEVERALADCDVLLGPACCVRAIPNGGAGGTVGPSVVAGQTVDPLVGWCPTWPWNLTGHPAVAVPVALVDGTPVAVQIVGRRHADAQVLAVAAALEQAHPWRDWYDHLPLEDPHPCPI